METLFPIACAGLVVVAIVWSILHMRAGGKGWHGIAGAWLSTLVMAAVSFAAYVEWIWAVPEVPFLMWVLGLALLGIELTKARYGSPPGGRTALACNILALVFSGGAFLVVMWIATVSPGGV